MRICTQAAVMAFVASLALGTVPAKAQELVGPYERGAFNVGGTRIMYFAVKFHGEFNRQNMAAAARYGAQKVAQMGVTHILGHIGNIAADDNTHLVVGFTIADGGSHWTAVRVVGRTNCEYRVRGQNGGFTGGWAAQDVATPNGSEIRYQFGDDDRGGLVWEMKHFRRD